MCRVKTWFLVGATLAAAAVFPLPGCGLAVPSPHRRLVVVLLDETASFKDYWLPSVALAATVADRLKPGDAFAVIGIDDHGMDPDDARIPVTQIDPGSLKALGDKRALAKKVKALERRASKRALTDVLGAIQQAAIFSDAPAVQSYKPVLLFFSDMQQTPSLPGPADVKGWKFATRGEAYCFYVNVSGWADPTVKRKGTTWDTMVESWAAVLDAAGLDADPKTSFHGRDVSQVEINRLFPAGF